MSLRRSFFPSPPPMPSSCCQSCPSPAAFCSSTLKSRTWQSPRPSLQSLSGPLPSATSSCPPRAPPATDFPSFSAHFAPLNLLASSCSNSIFHLRTKSLPDRKLLRFFDISRSRGLTALSSPPAPSKFDFLPLVVTLIPFATRRRLTRLAGGSGFFTVDHLKRFFDVRYSNDVSARPYLAQLIFFPQPPREPAIGDGLLANLTAFA